MFKTVLSYLKRLTREEVELRTLQSSQMLNYQMLNLSNVKLHVLGSRLSVLGKVIEDELTGIVENYMKHGIPMTNHILRLNIMTLVSACTIDICILTVAIIVPDEVEVEKDLGPVEDEAEDADDEAEEEETEEETRFHLKDRGRKTLWLVVSEKESTVKIKKLICTYILMKKLR